MEKGRARKGGNLATPESGVPVRQGGTRCSRQGKKWLELCFHSEKFTKLSVNQKKISSPCNARGHYGELITLVGSGRPMVEGQR